MTCFESTIGGGPFYVFKNVYRTCPALLACGTVVMRTSAHDYDRCT